MPDTLDQQAIDRSEKVLDALFGGAPVEEESPDATVVEEEVVVKTPVEIPDDTEEDWDASPPDKKDDEEEEPDLKNESVAQQQAKLKGREAKELKAKLTERELELERIQKERDDFRTRLEEVESVQIRPEDHSDFKELRDSIMADVEQSSELLPIDDPNAFVTNFGPLMAEYQKVSSLKGEERVEARRALKDLIMDTLGVVDDFAVTEVLKVIQRNAGKTGELQKLHSHLSERAKVGLLSTGVKNYENTVNEFRPVLDSVGDLADDIIETSPHTVEAVVAKMVKESPDAKRRLEKAKADVLEVIVGPRALTQSEIDKLQANGTDVKQFLAERGKAHRDKQKKLAALFVQGLMTRTTLKDTLAKLAKYEAEDDELDTIHRTTKKKAAPVAPDVRPKDRPSPLEKLFGPAD